MVLSQSQIELLSRYCTQASGHLERLHSADALLRVNLGQRYENISTKLMAPLNSRIALAGNDGLDLAKTAVDFNDKLTDFRSSYLDYDNQIEQTLKMNCRDEPVEFYSRLESARDKRAVVDKDVQEMSRLIEQYRLQFEEFARDSSAGGDRLWVSLSFTND